MRFNKSNILYILWALLLLTVITASHIDFAKKETRPLLADELEYGYLSIPYYHLTFNKEHISDEQKTHQQYIYNSNISDVTLLHKYLALNFYLFEKSLLVFRLSLLPLFYLMLFSVFLLLYLLCKNKFTSFVAITLFCSSPILISYSRTLWTPLYSGIFILLGLSFYVLSVKLTKKTYAYLSALAFALACCFHYSGLLFSGICISFIFLKNRKEQKICLSFFILFYLIPQIKTIAPMLLAKTKGCISGIHPPKHLKEYTFMWLQDIFWHRSIFYGLLLFFVLTSIYHLIINRKKTPTIFFLFYLLMLPSIWLIKINTGIQTHFVMLFVSAIIVFYTIATTPKLKKLNMLILLLALIGFHFTFIGNISVMKNDKACTLAVTPNENILKTKKIISFFKTHKDSVSTITLLNPDEFPIQARYPLDIFYLELALPNFKNVIFSQLNSINDLNKWIKHPSKNGNYFIVEENSKTTNVFFMSLKTKLDKKENLQDKEILSADETIFTIYHFD